MTVHVSCAKIISVHCTVDRHKFYVGSRLLNIQFSNVMPDRSIAIWLGQMADGNILSVHVFLYSVWSIYSGQTYILCRVKAVKIYFSNVMPHTGLLIYKPDQIAAYCHCMFSCI